MSIGALVAVGVPVIVVVALVFRAIWRQWCARQADGGEARLRVSAQCRDWSGSFEPARSGAA